MCTGAGSEMAISATLRVRFPRAGLLERAFLGRGRVRRLLAAPEPREVIDYFLPVCYAAVQQQED